MRANIKMGLLCATVAMFWEMTQEELKFGTGNIKEICIPLVIAKSHLYVTRWQVKLKTALLHLHLHLARGKSIIFSVP